MADGNTPRAMVKALLKGEPPARPLLMPIIFSLGSRLESLPLRDFQRSPTKIANALRQIRGALKVDGLACYFDPLLEFEALGGKIAWQADGSAAVAGSPCGDIANLGKLPSPEQVIHHERVRVASDVLHRLRVMLHDDPPLMVGVTGPFTLAGQLLGRAADNFELLQFAAEICAALCKTLLESGADIVFLTETSLPPAPAEWWEKWALLLDPIINVIRFYEALPVLFLKDASGAREDLGPVLDRDWNCVLSLDFGGGDAAAEKYRLAERSLGVALPTSFMWRTMSDSGTSATAITQVLHGEKPILLFSTGDLPPGCDLKQLASLLGTIRTDLLRVV